MNRLSREIFVERTRDLLTRQGSADVSLSSVLNACDANKGSLYHFFPNGKDELVIAAIERQSQLAISINQKFLEDSDSAADAVHGLVTSLAKKMDQSDHSLCLPFSAVGAVAGGASEALRSACAETLVKLESLFAKALKRDGVPTKLSRTLACMVVSTIEGALLQSRTRKTSVPLRNAAIQLRDLIDSQMSKA